MTEAELTDLFYQINGVLFPGGGADLDPRHPYYKALNTIFQLAIKVPARTHCRISN